jgi:chromosome segregation ATPase
LIEELYRDVEQLRDELVRKSDEIDEGRRKLAERGRQLAEQRKESGRLVHLLEQQEARLSEALGELKLLREHSQTEREEAKAREATRLAFLEQKLRAAEAERDQARHEINVLQASLAGSGNSGESLAPLMNELGDLRRQLGETQSQLNDARTQLSAAIERSTASGLGTSDPAPVLLAELGEMRKQLAAAIEKAAHQAPLVVSGDGQPADPAVLERFQRERIELESELELVRTRATELQEVVNQQRRELVEQRADITTELRLLRELVEQRPAHTAEAYEPDEDALIAASRGESLEAAPDPVVSSVMAQFARLQKDVAQRRKKK